MAEVLTSSEAARLCGVSFRTVIRWIERGHLQAYRLPGRGDYRVPVAELHRFMQANAIPEPPELHREMPRRVLIVEDEPHMVRAMERVLKGAGFATASAGDGFAAGVLLHAYQPGLLTLDLRMPGVDGLAVLQTLRENPLPFACKVLVVSGEAPARLQETLALGADGVLAKPFTSEELLTAVARLYGEKGKNPE
jgi:excisionase family DNA binding protein